MTKHTSTMTRLSAAALFLLLAATVPGAGLGAAGGDDASAGKLHAEAEEHVAAGRFRDAARALEQAVRLEPDAWHARALLGFCRLKQRQFTAALEACERALELKPDDVHAALWRAMCLKELRRYQDAIAAYETLLESKPGRLAVIDCHWGLAESMQALDLNEEADAHVAEVVKRDGRRGRVLDATLRLRRGDVNGARRRFERLLRADDEHPLILYGLAVCLLKLNQEQEFALQLLDQIGTTPELDPADVLLARALALIKLSRHEEAEQLMRELDPAAGLTPAQEAVRKEVTEAVQKVLGE
jgi:tetratricopeptide (TPR) repeat protein